MVHPAEVLRGIDASELKARCGEERVKAEAAREALRTILDQGEVSIFRVTLDKYGPPLFRWAPRRLVPLNPDAASLFSE